MKKRTIGILATALRCARFASSRTLLQSPGMAVGVVAEAGMEVAVEVAVVTAEPT